MPPKTKETKQPKKHVKNFYELAKVKALLPTSHNPNYSEHGIKLPFRAISVSASGGGKSNALLQLISIMGSTFNKIIIFTKRMEPLYQFLLDEIPGDLIEIHFDLDVLEEYDEDDFIGQTLMVFDDQCSETLKVQKPIVEMFIRGRKMGISMIYLSQSYFSTPSLIRKQLNYIFVIKISQVADFKRIANEYETATKEKLIKAYDYCTSEFGDFMLLDLQGPQHKKIRKNFDEFLDMKFF